MEHPQPRGNDMNYIANHPIKAAGFGVLAILVAIALFFVKSNR